MGDYKRSYIRLSHIPWRVSSFTMKSGGSSLDEKLSSISELILY